MTVVTTFDISGKTAIVAGSGMGWTPAIASALAEAGAAIVIAGSIRSECETVMNAVRKVGGSASYIQADLTSRAEVETMVADVLSTTNRIDILVNNFGIEFSKPFIDITDTEWDAVMANSIRSTFLCCQSVGKHMLSQKFGRIVNIGSGLMDRGLPNGTAIGASQGSIRQLTASLALEWATRGVRVNAIAAGFLIPDKAGVEKGTMQIPAKYIPLKREGHASDLCGLLIYMASDASDFVTGQTFHIDGGLISHA